MSDSNSRQGRQLRSTPQQFRTRDDGDDLIIEGYFAVFDSPYVLWDGATEIVKPGAFAGCLSGDIRALIDHDTRLVLGRTKAGTLTLREDARGLYGTIKINRDDADAMSLYARVQRGDVDQCSFGFDIEEETFVDLGGGQCRWEINKVNPLYEVSVVTYPAYEETAVKARHADLAEIQRRQAEAWKTKMKTRLTGGDNHGT
jgi:HK97 family phage prohead protease|nr:MAG TPA: prohead serine protease [Caudoviricetes sp.]DAU96062.1 MAG TPA: prohead serine protease [Caudoviricetes sp.]